MAPEPARVFYWYFACARGCSFWIEQPGPTLPPGWERLTCRYCAAPLRAFYPKAVTP